MARFKGGNLELTSSNKIIHGSQTVLDSSRKGLFSQLKLDLGADIDEFSTDGTLTGNSDSALPTEKAVKTYVDAAGGGISYEIISGNTTAEAAKGYLIDASDNDVTLTLPLTPSEGDTVAAVDLYNMATTNTITVGRNGENIEGESQDLIVDVDGAGFTMVFSDSTRGWTIVSEIGAGGTNYRYVDRGDPSAWDWDKNDLTTDGTWRDLDCSSIVSSDAIAILFRLYISDDAASNSMSIRPNGNTNTQNVFQLRTQVANIVNNASGIVACDSNQVVEYMASNTTWTGIYIQILGWFTEGGSSGGDVCADSDIGDNKLVRGDGGAKKIQECSTITVSDNGEMVNTGQPAFEAEISGDQENVTGDDTGFNLTGAIWTEIFDQGNDFSNGTFTAPVTGRYLFTGILFLGDLEAAHTRMYLSIVTSNRTYYPLQLNPYAIHYGSGFLLVNFSQICDMDANDTIYITTAVYDGNKVVDIIDEHTKFSGALIC